MTPLISNHSRECHSLNPKFLENEKMNSSACKDQVAVSHLSKQALKPSDQNPNSLKTKSFSSTPSLNTDGENDKFQNFQSTYKKTKQIFVQVLSVQAKILAFSEYWSKNKYNIANVAHFFDPDYARTSENLLNYFDFFYKWFDCIVPLFTQLSKFHFMCTAENQLEELKSPTKPLNKVSLDSSQSSYTSGQKNHHQFKLKLNHDKKETVDKLFSKLKRLGTKISPPLIATFEILSLKTAEKISKCIYEIDKIRLGFLDCNQTNALQNEWFFHLQPHLSVLIKQDFASPEEKESFDSKKFENKALEEKVKSFLISLHKCKTLENVQKIFEELKLNIEIPRTIEQFNEQLKHPRFLRELVQHYFQVVGRKVVLEENRVTSTLKKKVEEHQIKIDRYLPILAEQLDLWRDQQLSFEEIKIHLAKLHIDIRANHSQKFPQDQLEWEECLKNETFIRALAEQWVHFQETTAQLGMQGLRQALLSKLSVEREFLSFQKIQHCIELASSAIQLSLCYGPFKLLGIGSAIEILISDLTKLGIPSLGLFHVGYPLYPEIKFRIDSIIILIVKHFFGIKYKPNEYSFESYKLASQIHMTHLIAMLSFVQLLIRQGLLWVNMSLVDNCIKGLNHQVITEDQRYIELENEYQEYQLYCRKLLQYFEENLEQHRLSDAILIILSQPQSAYNAFFNPIQNLAESLKEADIDYFPTEVLEFFENHLGFKLTNANKHGLQDHLESFFAKDHKSFSQSFSDQRFAYMN